MNDPQISIIIPTYRRPALLKRALKSALKQTYSNFKVQIYDNASGDATPEVAAEFMKCDPRIFYHCHSENIGMLGNYQHAFNKVDTAFFTFLSDDDIIFPWYLDTVLEGFKHYPDIAFSASSALIISDDAQVQAVPLCLWKKEGLYNPPEGFLEMIEKYPVPTCILFSKKVLEDAKKIDMQNAILWDCDFLLKLASHFSFVISKKPCGILVTHHESFAASANLKSWMIGYSKLIRRVEDMELISQEAKNSALGILNKRYLQIMSLLCKSCLWQQDDIFLKSVEENLKHMANRSKKLMLMLFLVKMSQIFRVIQSTLVFIKKYKRKFTEFPRKSSVSSLQREYGQYAAWFQLLENEK
jgi:glycosyltransferase involved in cell wall biosynthesis